MTPDDATPSADLGAEAALLGACLANAGALDEVSDMIKPADFYRPAHADLFTALVTMRDKGRPTDPVSAADFLGPYDLERLGGAGYLHELQASVVVATNATYFAEIIVSHALRRGLRDAGTRAQQLARTPSDDVIELIGRARESLDELLSRATPGNELIEIGDLAESALTRYRQPAPPSLPTGLYDLDANLSGGLWPGTLVVIGARPGKGKSILGGLLALNAAISGKGALYLSLEMTKDEITDRMVAHLSSVRLDRITSHQLGQREWDSVMHAADKVRDLPLAIIDDHNMGIAGIRSRARERMRTARGLALVVIDQLNLIRPTTARTKREEEVADLSRSLKLLAKELRLPIVVLHQLNREPERRGDGRPQLSDLRESGMVEANADVGILLHPQPDDDPRAGEVDLIIAKNRQGPQKTVTASWQPHLARIADLAKTDY